MKRLLFIIVLLTSFASNAQNWSDHSFVEAYERYNNAGITTTKVKLDSIYRYSNSNFANLELEELHIADSIFNWEIDHAKSLQSEFYWNVEYSKLLKANKLVGKTSLVLHRNLEIALELNDTLKILDANRSIAYFYYGNEMHDEALSFIWKTTTIVQNINDPKAKETHYGSIAWQLTNMAYSTQNKTLQDSAIKYSLLAHSYVDPVLEPSSFKERSFVAALCLARGQRRQECIDFSNEVLSKMDPSAGLHGRLYPLILEQYIVLDKKDSAYHYGDLYVDWDLKYNPPRNIIINTEDGRSAEAFNMANTVRAYIKFGDFKKATYLIDQVLFSDSLSEDIDMLSYYRQLGVPAYEGTGEIAKALACQKALSDYSDSIYDKTSEAELQSHRELLEASIFLEKKGAEKLAKQQEEILETQKANKNLQFWIFSIGVLGLIIFLLTLNSRFKKAKAQKRIIEDQKMKVEEAHKEIKDSIAYAKRIQSAILPPDSLIKSALPHSFVLYKPKDVVAGDFYWLSKNGEDVLFAAADCTGHGVPGAMVSVVCNGALNRAVREFGLTEPGKILDKARDIVIEEFEKSEEEVKDGMDIALCHLSGNTLKFAGANNPLWILRNGEILETKGDKQPIGKFEHAQPFATHEVILEKGDIIYILSDGFVDQFGGDKGKKLKAKNLKAILLENANKSMDEQCVVLDAAFENWRGGLEQIDDVCVIGVKI